MFINRNMVPSWRTFAFLLLGFVALTSVGCGGDGPPSTVGAMHPVKGTVKSEVGGTISGLTIAFTPDESSTARIAKGEVKSDGSFELATIDPGDGIAEGNYKIHFEAPVVIGKSKQPPPPIPIRFLDEDASGLTMSVKPDTTTLGTIVLKAAPKRSRDND